MEIWANWYSTNAPTVHQVNIDGTNHDMTLTRGTTTNGAYMYAYTLPDSACHWYYFIFSDGTTTTYHPTSGQLALGDSCTSDYKSDTTESSNNGQSSTNNHQSSTNADESSTNADESSTNAGESSTNADESSTNVDTSSTNTDQSSNNDQSSSNNDSAFLVTYYWTDDGLPT